MLSLHEIVAWFLGIGMSLWFGTAILNEVFHLVKDYLKQFKIVRR